MYAPSAPAVIDGSDPNTQTCEGYMRGRLAVATGLILAGAFAAPAAAAATATPASAQVFVGNNKLNVVAVLGVANDIAVSLSGTTYTVHDANLPLAPGIGCSAVDSQTVTCPLTGAATIEVLVSDGNDHVVISANKPALVDGDSGSDLIEMQQTVKLTTPNTLRGGTDNDEIFGSIGRDNISGGFHNDHIVGGGGADSMSGESGDDTLFDGDQFPPDSADVFNGGNAGHDVCFGENSLDPKFGTDTFVGCEVGGSVD